MARTKNPNVEKENPSDKTPTRRRTSTQIRIEEPAPEQNRPVRIKKMAAKQSFTGKGKEKVLPSPMDKRRRDSTSDTESDEMVLMKKAMAESKREHLKKKQKTGNTSSAPTEFPELNLPYLDGNIDEGVNKLRFNKFFREKKCCPVVSVDLDAIRIDPEFRLDLTREFGRYRKWLEIKEEYSPAVVRRFYCNMEPVKRYSDIEFLVPERYILTTSLRGRKIEITKELLNKILDIPEEEEEPLPPLTLGEAQRIILQRDQEMPIIKKLRPSRMCDKYRIIHYIVSRNIMNKSYSFTYMSHEDIYMMARIIRGDRMNVGEILFNIMKSYSAGKWQTSALIPIPQMVSFLLKKLNIAHLQGEETKEIKVFDLTHLKRMKLELPYDPDRSMMTPDQKKKEKKPTASDATQEAEHSSTPPSAGFMNRIEVILASMQTELAEIKENQRRIQLRVDNIEELIVTYLHKTHGPSISEEDLVRTTPVQSPSPPPESAPEPAPIVPSADLASQPSADPAPSPDPVPEQSSSDFSSVPTPELSHRKSPQPEPQTSPIQIIEIPSSPESEPLSPIHPLALVPTPKKEQ